MPDTNNSEDKRIFEEQLVKEIVRNERLRAKILGFVALLLLITLIGIYSFFNETIMNTMLSVLPLYALGAMLLFLILREITVYRFLSKRLEENKGLSKKLQYINLFIESSIPTLIMLITSYIIENMYIVLSPAAFLYFVVIILSTLSLDYKLSVFVGVVTSVQYLLAVYFLTAHYGYKVESPVLTEIFFYLGKGIILLASGIIAGHVASALKNRIYKAYKETNERNKVINLFGQQVSKEIVSELIKHQDELKSERKFVCVMFLDIRGFTPLVENKQPEEIIQFQNDVFGFMIDIITKNHGIINQFLGDGYMATFGAPVGYENDCQNAVNAAIEIVETVNKKSESGEIERTRIGIGLHAGYVVAGNVGTAVRKQYSISGNTVILAARIEQLNKQFKTQFLISQEVLDNVESGGIAPEDLGEVDLKGREKPIRIYKLA